MIRSFADEATQDVYRGRRPAGFPADLIKRARRKLALLDSTAKLNDLRTPAGNDLHALVGGRKGQYAIRLNEKYRLCFVWNHEDGSADDVEIVDYH